jgi:uncharacterized protein
MKAIGFDRMKYGLLLAPGAGADANSPALIAIENAMPKNVSVWRMDFPYRKAGRRAPDREPVLLDAARKELAEFSKTSRIPRKRIFLGGRSMGGRMCSMVAAEGVDCAGLALVSYPLHPPGKPEKLRVDHFPRIAVPTLFVSGTRDAFGTPEEFAKYTRTIEGDVTHEWIEGGDHGLRKSSEQAAQIVCDWILKNT